MSTASVTTASTVPSSNPKMTSTASTTSTAVAINWEKTTNDLRREIRSMCKTQEHQSVQILNISRFQQKLGAEEALARLAQERKKRLSKMLLEPRNEYFSQIPNLTLFYFFY
jgi:hypothetical protein